MGVVWFMIGVVVGGLCLFFNSRVSVLQALRGVDDDVLEALRRQGLSEAFFEGQRRFDEEREAIQKKSEA